MLHVTSIEQQSKFFTEGHFFKVKPSIGLTLIFLFVSPKLSFQMFFVDKNFLKKCKKYRRSLHEASEAYMNILPESRTTEVKSLVWNADQQVDKMIEEATAKHRHLDDVNKKWKTFDTLIESVTKWMEEAEALITNGTLKACKVRRVK